MAVTRLQLRNRVRRRIRDFYKDSDTLNEAVDTSETDIDVTDGTKYYKGAIIQVDDEVMLVTADPSGNTITVLRGFRGSTAAAHDNAQTVYIVDKFSDFEINSLLDDVIIDGFPILFSYIVDETATTDADALEYDIPTALSGGRVARAFENQGSATKQDWIPLTIDFQSMTKWYLSDRAGAGGRTIRLVGVAPFSGFSGDTDTYDGWDNEVEYLILETMARLVDARNIERFEDPGYVSTVKQEGSSMNTVTQLGTYFHRLAERKLDRVKKAKPIKLVNLIAKV